MFKKVATLEPQGNIVQMRQGAASGGMTAAEMDAALAGIFYHATAGTYFVPRANSPGWVTLDKASVGNALKQRGIRESEDRAQCLFRLQTAHAIDFAGGLAGHPCGTVQAGGRTMLVTEQRTRIEPAAGEWPRIRALLKDLLAGETEPEAEVQWHTVLAWCQCFLRSLESRVRRPGQALVLAGARGCGKSFLLKILTRLFGGRAASPFDYMTGRTPFNAQLFGAEVLAIDDAPASTDFRARRSLGGNIKAMIYSNSHMCHPKGRTAIDLAPLWRIVVCVNAEPEALQVLPHFDESLEDKLIVFRCQKADIPDHETMEERQALEAAYLAELPAFAHYLLHGYSLPASYHDRRNGVASFRHPEIEAQVNALSPENALLRIIVAHYGQSRETLILTASALEAELRQGSQSREADKLLTHPNTCGTYLSRLAGRYPHGFTKAGMAHGNATKWEIDLQALNEGQS